MNKAILFSMTEAEQMLISETSRDELRALNEDELLEMETRIRRARNKYVKLYRRQASARVAELGGRGFAAPKNQRNRDKAEVFELALARVSRQVGCRSESCLGAACRTNQGGAFGRHLFTTGADARLPSDRHRAGRTPREVHRWSQA